MIRRQAEAREVLDHTVEVLARQMTEPGANLVGLALIDQRRANRWLKRRCFLSLTTLLLFFQILITQNKKKIRFHIFNNAEKKKKFTVRFLIFCKSELLKKCFTRDLSILGE